MWLQQLAIFLFCLICFSSTEDIWKSNSNDEKLLFAHVIYRHGDRNIAKAYPKDPYKDEIHWKGGIGQLTNEGKRQQYKLGQYFRRRYNKLIGDKYSANKVYIRSTDFDRTIMSAQVNLVGLYPTNDDEVWNEQLLWNPIPVHTVPTRDDHILLGPKNQAKNCPKFDVALQKYIKESPEVQTILTKYRHLFLFWSKMCGLDIETIAIFSIDDQLK